MFSNEPHTQNQKKNNLKLKKSRRMNEHKLFKPHGSNRIIEDVTDDRTIDPMGKFNNDLDMKYELFCKWLQQNENGAQLSDEIDRRNFCNVSRGPTLTEDEVSSFASNSDDSTNDVFLDTETEQPMIMVNGMVEVPNANATAVDGGSAAIETMDSRANTPMSQLSASDFDCSSSDVTVNSTGKANGNSKRKPKHKKGRAPPIPTAATEINSNSAECDTNSTNLARETDI